MTTYVLVRHGESDWDAVAAAGLAGPSSDLATLTPAGSRQMADVATRLYDDPPDEVISSPMTRALQSAHVVATALAVPLSVELGLREWSCDRRGAWRDHAEFVRNYHLLLDDERERRTGEDRVWESLDEVRARVRVALARHVGRRVVVVSHCLAIYAFTGTELRPGESLEWTAGATDRAGSGR